MLPLSITAWIAYRKDIKEMIGAEQDDDITPTDSDISIVENEIRQIEEYNQENNLGPTAINV